MTFLTPLELRNSLKISRATENRLLKRGMPHIGGGRLRRYEQEAAVEWFDSYARQASSLRKMLVPGDYQCIECGFVGRVGQPMPPPHCPKCNAQGRLRRVG